MKLKINLHSFTSIVRAAMTIGGVASAVHPGASPIVASLGGASVGIAIAWSQINALLHPHSPSAAHDAADVEEIQSRVISPFGTL